MFNQIIAYTDKMAHVVVGGVAFAAIPVIGCNGRKVVPMCGRERIAITDAEIKRAFIAKNGGRFIRNRWYK